MKIPNDNIPTAEDWILTKAEGYEAKLELANKVILMYQSLPWYKKLFKSKKLFRQYFHELRLLDRENNIKAEKIRKEIEEASSEIVRVYKRKSE